jgi:hypothetical protein
MVHPPHRTLHRRAALQAAALAVLVAAGVACGVWQSRRPANADEVAIATGEVRSHSAELAVLAADAGRKLPPRFARAHVGQLGQSVARTADEVASLHPQPAVAAAAQALQSPLREIEAELRTARHAGLPALAASAAAARQRTERLDRAEQALQR